MGNTEEEIVNRLVNYHRYIDGIQRCYSTVVKTINADQPKADVFAQGLFDISVVGVVNCLYVFIRELQFYLILIYIVFPFQQERDVALW